MTLPSTLSGNPQIIRLSASMLDRRQHDCLTFAALKARPETWSRPSEPRRYAPWESFPLGLVMEALDAIEFRGIDVDVAVTHVLGACRNRVHPGAARWIRHACHTYLETTESLSAELGANGIELLPERNPRIVQQGGSLTEMRALTAWGRWYGSADGTVVEFRRMRFRRPLGHPDGPSTIAMAYVAAAGNQVVNRADVYKVVPIPVRELGTRPQRVRVVEVGLTDGITQVLVDAAPEEIRQNYLRSAKPVAAGLLSADTRSPGSDCAECKLRPSCGALPRTPGLIGLADRGTHRRTWSITTARQYQICPAQAHLRDLRLPAEQSESAALRRGLVVHRWLETAHGRPDARPCLPEDLPDADAADIGLATGLMDREDYREALAYLRQHPHVCPLSGPGDVTEVVPEPKVTVYDPDADVVVIANPDLLRRVDGRLVYREQKTSSVPRVITTENALDLVPQLALAVCLIAHGALGDTTGVVELEQLTPFSGQVITFDVADPQVVTAARAVLSERARKWHHDTVFRTNPGPWCRFCPVARWCADASRTESNAPLSLNGLVIDPVSGEILQATGQVDSRAEAIADSITETEIDDEPLF